MFSRFFCFFQGGCRVLGFRALGLEGSAQGLEVVKGSGVVEFRGLGVRVPVAQKTYCFKKLYIETILRNHYR